MLLVASSDGRTDGGTFRQHDDFMYFTGLEVPNSMLVLDADTEESLSARILEAEHRLYPKAVDLVVRGQVRIAGRRVLGSEA